MNGKGTPFHIHSLKPESVSKTHAQEIQDDFMKDSQADQPVTNL
jgi:hypothetical protein